MEQKFNLFRKYSKKRGFTIVELLIVIAVISILAAVLIPTFSGIVKKARISAKTQTAQSINKILLLDELTEDRPANMHEVVKTMLEKDFTNITIIKDLAGIDRVIVAQLQ